MMYDLFMLFEHNSVNDKRVANLNKQKVIRNSYINTCTRFYTSNFDVTRMHRFSQKWQLRVCKWTFGVCKMPLLMKIPMKIKEFW